MNPELGCGNVMSHVWENPAGWTHFTVPVEAWGWGEPRVTGRGPGVQGILSLRPDPLFQQPCSGEASGWGGVAFPSWRVAWVAASVTLCLLMSVPGSWPAAGSGLWSPTPQRGQVGGGGSHLSCHHALRHRQARTRPRPGSPPPVPPLHEQISCLQS